MRLTRFAVLGSVLALGACATAPAPRPVVGLPGPGKDIAAFQKEEKACRGDASQAAHTPGPATGTTNTQWQAFFDRYAQCETAHGNVVQPVPWAVAYADYLGTNAGPYGYYGYPYAYAGYPFYYGYYGGPFLFGYPYPFFFGAGYGFGYGHFRGGFGHGGFYGGHR